MWDSNIRLPATKIGLQSRNQKVRLRSETLTYGCLQPELRSLLRNYIFQLPLRFQVSFPYAPIRTPQRCPHEPEEVHGEHHPCERLPPLGTRRMGRMKKLEERKKPLSSSSGAHNENHGGRRYWRKHQNVWT